MGGGGDDGASDLMQRQLADSEAAVQNKLKAVMATRMALIKAQGAQQWQPSMTPTPTPGQGASSAGGKM